MVVPDLWSALVLSTLLLVVLASLCLCYVVAADANARGASGFAWGALTFVLAPVTIPAYLLYRRRLPARDDPPGPTERRIGAFGIGGVAAYVTGSIVSPPDPMSLVVYTLPLLVVFVPLATRVYAPR
ncbi:hypothetical protein [Natronorubrum sp. DTA7]|uniref:hypothetical protein n=1 Tax=Natronorubrum sp. DTA7 TaxID=3447016 RepID=UPI003F855B2D